MVAITQNPGIMNPQYEIGVQVNPRKLNPQLNINLPIPPNVIFFRQFKAGETLPVLFKATGNLVELESKPQTLKFVRDIFVRATKTELTFSLDQANWKPFNSIFNGSYDLKVVQNDHDSSPQAIVQLHANAR
ncbi:MAG: hypothetical protein S4CHLAM6_14050 [Chlamydiae bacterium]|nr:hypothetical protein [Chlamydiota bacterium]